MNSGSIDNRSFLPYHSATQPGLVVGTILMKLLGKPSALEEQPDQMMVDLRFSLYK